MFPNSAFSNVKGLTNSLFPQQSGIFAFVSTSQFLPFLAWIRLPPSPHYHLNSLSLVPALHLTCCHVNKAQEALSTPSTAWCLYSLISLNTSLLALAGNEDVPPTSARGPAARWLIEGQCGPLAGSTPMLSHSWGRAGSAGSLYLSGPQRQRPGLPEIRPLSLGPKLFILNNDTGLAAGTCSGHEQETAFPQGFQAGSALFTSHENCTLELYTYIHIWKEDDLLYYWWEPHMSGHIFDI